ncbi:MAG: hypothetical protein AB7O43_00465 [Hyphomicrobiaceae bacterium]
MATTLLIIHGLLAVVLIGGITHQAMAACWPARGGTSFFSAFRAVSGVRYAAVNIWLYVIVMVLGGSIYPAYRLAVRPYLESARLWSMNGSFELKEQFVAVGLGMLPLYWLVWRKPLDEKLSPARAAVTAILCFVVWYSFLVGHILNNARGLFGR